MYSGIYGEGSMKPFSILLYLRDSMSLTDESSRIFRTPEKKKNTSPESLEVPHANPKSW